MDEAKDVATRLKNRIESEEESREQKTVVLGILFAAFIEAVISLTWIILSFSYSTVFGFLLLLVLPTVICVTTYILLSENRG